MAVASVQVAPAAHIGLSPRQSPAATAAASASSAATTTATTGTGASGPSAAATIMESKSTVKPETNTTESKSKTSSPAQTKTSLPGASSTTRAEDSKPSTTQTTSEPLAPPPRPAQTSTGETPDYFSAVHNGGPNISSEFNPFEQSFGVPSAETPGGTRLPPVAALTSPAIPGANNSSAYNFPGSLRSGPLSPAMLEGPQGDYFGNISSRGFPTPNESSLRSGLTPGGGGSLFPAPSPNSQALYNSLASGGATPGTLDFHRTAMNAAARSKNSQYPSTSGNPDQPGASNMDAQHDATDAANGLFMLAKGGQANQFAVPNAASQPTMQTRGGQDQKKGARNNGSIGSGSGRDGNDGESQDDSKPATRGANKGKKATKSDTAVNGRRKSEATQKGSNKKSKGNNGNANVDPALEDHDDDDMDDDMMDDDDDLMGDHPHKDPKKMTDEEKRRNFLERNRVAALKCRQRKKQWLANLQHKVEMYSAENDNLNSQVAQLHEEIRSLRTLLMGHKDCPVGHAQGIGQFLNAGMQDAPNFGGHQVNPYGMAMANGAGIQSGMQRS